MHRRAWYLLGCLFLLTTSAGCNCGGEPAPDSGTPDSGTQDTESGTPDTQTPESGILDSGTPDPETPDSGDGCPVCPAHSTCEVGEGSPRCRCDPGYLADAGGCEDVAAALDKLRWELPCVAAHVGDGCVTGPRQQTAMTLGGDPATTYEVALRFRGVVEYVAVTGGQRSGTFSIGGSPEDVGYNIYALRVSDPFETYYLNAGASGARRIYPVSSAHSIRVQGGATLTMVGDPVDGAEIINTDGDGGTNVVPGVPPAPAAFDGQFLQMDVLSVRRL
jgi:hypothetical protein